MFKRLSFSARVIIFLAFVVSIVVVTPAIYGVMQSVDDAHDQLRTRATLVAELQAGAIARPMWDMNDQAVQGLVEKLGKDPDFHSAEILDPSGTSTTTYQAPDANGGAGDASVMTIEAPIKIDDGGSEEVLGTLVVRMSLKRLAAAESALMTQEAIKLIVILIVVLGTVYVGFAMINRPIQAISNAMMSLASGTLEIDIPATKREDEIGEMARTVEVFKENALRVETLNRERVETERRNHEDRKRARLELADQFERDIGAIKDSVTRESRQLNANADALSRASGVADDETGLVSHTSEEISQDVHAVAASTEQLSASVSEVAGKVQENSTLTNQAGREVRDTSAAVTALSEAASRIGEIVEIINDIADQTNLLALNATIEAARAGEAGKGFAVVAGEVKNLANQTARATGEIAGQIEAVQSTSQRVVTAISSITRIVEQTEEISANVAAAIEEQSAATNEIARLATTMSGRMDNMTSQVGRVRDATNDAQSAAQTVLNASTSLASVSNDLERQSESFLRDIRES